MNIVKSGAFLLAALVIAALAQASAQSGKRDDGKPKPMVLQAQKVKPKPYTARIPNTPDASQNISWSDFLLHPEMGPGAIERNSPPDEYNQSMDFFPENFCGPAAIANNLIWLDRTGYPHISNEPNKYAASMMLALSLGHDYMNTMSRPDEQDWGNGVTWTDIPVGAGTSLGSLVNGAVRYLDEKKIPIKQIRITSSVDRSDVNFNTKGAPFEFEVAKPLSAMIESALRRRSIVVTLHGHYKPLGDPLEGLKHPEAKTGGVAASTTPKKPSGAPIGWESFYYERTGGHYAAPVGYGIDKNGNEAPGKIIYHDSANALQTTRRQHIYSWEKVVTGIAGRNPVLVNIEKRRTLPNEEMRCPFAKGPLVNKDGKRISLECRGNLIGHSIMHYPTSYDAGQRIESLPGLPGVKSASNIKVLEMIIEIEVADPPKGPKRMR